MTYLDPDEAMDSLIGHQFVEWGRDENAVHIVLDDGRTLIFVGLGILTPQDHALH